MFFISMPIPLTHFPNFHLHILPNIYPYPQKIIQEFIHSQTPLSPSIHKTTLDPMFS